MIKITVITKSVHMLCMISMYTSKWLYRLNKYKLNYHCFSNFGFDKKECGFKKTIEKSKRMKQRDKSIKSMIKINNIDSVISLHSDWAWFTHLFVNKLNNLKCCIWSVI